MSAVNGQDELTQLLDTALNQMQESLKAIVGDNAPSG